MLTELASRYTEIHSARVCNNLEFSKYRIGNNPVSGVENVDSCAGLCKGNQTCNVFGYYPPQKKCDLFTKTCSSYSKIFPLY